VAEQFITMLTESTVTALLQSSVTGAGLVLAVYALVLPYASRILRARSSILGRNVLAFKEAATLTDTGISDNELARIRKIIDEIEAKKNYPAHLSAGGIGLAFFLFSLSSLMSLWWLMDWNRLFFDYWLPISFGIATLVFLFIGLYSVFDIHSILKQEFESLKEESGANVAGRK
jgi:hypothetical protein